MKLHYPGCQLDDKCTCQDFDVAQECEKENDDDCRDVVEFMKNGGSDETTCVGIRALMTEAID